MKKICMSLLILCLFSGGLAPISKGDAASSVGTVKGDNVNVYRSPSLHSSVVQTVKKEKNFLLFHLKREMQLKLSPIK